MLVPSPMLAAESSDARQKSQADYIGVVTCKQCHENEFEAWAGLHHLLAMQVANVTSVPGDFDNAEFKHYDVESTFFKRDGKFMVRTDGAYVNLADAYRQSGRDNEGEKVLRSGLARLPRAANLHHALGLLLVRKKDNTAGLQEIALAAKIEPDNARYAYVHAVGLHSTGKSTEALAVLRTAEKRHPYDLDILSALISMNLEAGDGKAALPYARKAAEVLPDDQGLRDLVAKLEGNR